MEYVFRTTTYDLEALMPELQQALLKRSELIDEDRARDPRAKSPEQVERKRKIVNAIYSVTLMVLGVYLVMMAVQQPERRVLAGLAAAWSFGTAIWSLLRVFRSGPVAKKPEDFAKPARALLTHIAKAEPCEVHFGEEGMTFKGAPTVPYADLDYFVEAPSAYLVSWTHQAATFLQKKDMVQGKEETFADFVTERL